MSSFQYACVRVCSKENIGSNDVKISAFACRVQGCYHVLIGGGGFEVLMAVLLESSLQGCYAVWTGKHL